MEKSLYHLSSIAVGFAAVEMPRNCSIAMDLPMEVPAEIWIVFLLHHCRRKKTKGRVGFDDASFFYARLRDSFGYPNLLRGLQIPIPLFDYYFSV